MFITFITCLLTEISVTLKSRSEKKAFVTPVGSHWVNSTHVPMQRLRTRWVTCVLALVNWCVSVAAAAEMGAAPPLQRHAKTPFASRLIINSPTSMVIRHFRQMFLITRYHDIIAHKHTCHLKQSELQKRSLWPRTGLQRGGTRSWRSRSGPKRNKKKRPKKEIREKVSFRVWQQLQSLSKPFSIEVKGRAQVIADDKISRNM